MNPRQRTYYFFFLGFMILTNESIAFNSSSSNNCNGSKKPTAFSRRNFMDKIATTFVSIGSLTVLETMEVATNNKDLVAYAADGQSTIWRSGKTPIVPSQKPKNPNDVKGTRKDPSFLRSIAQCKVSFGSIELAAS